MLPRLQAGLLTLPLSLTGETGKINKAGTGKYDETSMF